MSPTDFEPVRRLLHGAVGTVFPAAQLLVVDDFQRVFYEPAGDCTRETLFDLASLTKALSTTTLVMRLLDARKLRLSDELYPGGASIELALCHATGLPPWRALHQAAAPLLTRPGLSPGPGPGTAASDDNARRAIVDAARREPLEYPPGTRSAYSDLGFILLGDTVERVGGARLDAQWDALGFAPTYHPDPAACAPTEILAEGALRGVVHDDNARAMGGVAGHAGLFGDAAGVSTVIEALVRASWIPGKRRTSGKTATLVQPETVRRFWHPCAVPGSTWCLGWDRPATTGLSSAGARWPRDGVGHLGYTGCSIWIDPPRARWVILLSNRVHPTRRNESIKPFRPLLHDAIVRALDGD